jgi:phosphoribosylaminoimidazole (AIR) synthetase
MLELQRAKQRLAERGFEAGAVKNIANYAIKVASQQAKSVDDEQAVQQFKDALPKALEDAAKMYKDALETRGPVQSTAPRNTTGGGTTRKVFRAPPKLRAQ